MHLDLRPFIGVEIMLAVAVIVMIAWRKAVARGEDDTLHVLQGNALPNQAAVAHKLDAIDKWGKTLTVVAVVFRTDGRSDLHLPGLGAIDPVYGRDVDLHAEPGIISIRPDARFCPTGSDTRGSRRRSPGSGDSAACGVHFLPRPGAETGKERPRGSDLRYLPRVARKVSPPRQHSQARLRHLPPDQAGDYAQSVHGLARKAGNEGAPDCGVCHGSAHELLSPESEAFRKGVPDTCGMCHSDVAEQYGKSVHGQAVARGVNEAPLCTDCHGEHKIIKPSNEASPVNAAHIRETCGSCHGDVRLTRKFGLPSDRHGELRFLLPRPRGQGRLADGGQLRELSRRAQYSAVIGSEIHHQPQEPAADLRQMPSGRGHALRDQPGAPCARAEKSRRR